MEVIRVASIGQAGSEVGVAGIEPVTTPSPHATRAQKIKKIAGTTTSFQYVIGHA
ncbi:hypothetical protein [Caballeronia sordidicola]|uniref:Uncharacterized protein n=1 Tax=Caballeronia sordidicola TaxID=196367 RepID=A0A242MAB7_CABSO|nr:hypothetical protein [Caballeronia sordidicola]OTP68244.1 hypothetical protein PAMC26510_29465 [Caballeronia sordidicola]